MKLLALAAAALALSAGTPELGRLAVCHDGNYHDADDIGAVAMVEALLWKAGAQENLVHLDYGNHLGATTPSMHQAMALSATRALPYYGISPAVVWDDVTELEASTDRLAAEIGASTASDRLTIAQAGPWEVMAQAFDKADPARHRFVTIVSHGFWNDIHEHNTHHRTKDEFFAQYEPGGPFAGFVPPAFDSIPDQNDHAFKSSINGWGWLAVSPYTNYVFHRTLATGEAAGDMSDAGMVFYLLTGNATPIMPEVRAFFVE